MYLSLEAVTEVLHPLKRAAQADRAAFRNGQGPGATPPAAVAQGFVPYFKAITQAQRCAALEKWYERGVSLTGCETFGAVGIYSNDVMRSFARAFQDDVFPTYFGMKYQDVQPAQGLAIHDNALSCHTPTVGKWAKLISSAFVWGRNTRDAWLKPIQAQQAELNRMRFDSIAERATVAQVQPAPGRALGPFDAENRRYSRILHSDARVTVGARDLVSRKCLMSLEHAVGINLAQEESITPVIVKDVMDQVLMPLAQRGCPGTDLTLFADFYHQTLSVTHQGKLVPAGSAQITHETPRANASYGPGHRQQKALPTLSYGGINYNYPELASLDGIIDFEKRGSRNPEKAAQYAVKTETTYVNYKPTEPRGSIKALKFGRLLQQLADRDFFGVYRDGIYISTSNRSSDGANAAAELFGALPGLERFDPQSDAVTPRKRGFSYAINAFSQVCRAALGPNPATYTPVWQEKVGESVRHDAFVTVVTSHMKTMVGETIYMNPAYRPLYARMVETEKTIILRDIFKLRDELSLEQLLMGEASWRPLVLVKALQDDATAYFKAIGCESGKVLLRNWAEFIDGPKAAVRPNGDYPMVVEKKRDEVIVAIGDAPASVAPVYPYTEGTRLIVNYYGDR